TDRIPPYSEEAERGVLGSLMLDTEHVLDMCRMCQLQPRSFYVPAHQLLYETFSAMADEGRPVDLLTAGEYLKTAGLLERIGGHPFLERLVDSTPTAAHADYYIKLVHENDLLRTMIRQAQKTIEDCYAHEGDPQNLLNETEQAFYDIAHARHRDLTKWEELVKDGHKKINEIITSNKDLTGLPTGFADLDRITRGLQNGDLIIIAARPSMGKTALALNIAENAALHHDTHHPVAVFSLEMSAEALVRRMICCRARISAHSLGRGYLAQELHGQLVTAVDTLMRAPIVVDDSAGLEVAELRSRARQIQRKHNIELIIVDYLQLLHCKSAAREGRQNEVAAISSELKVMAKELKVPVLCLSQLSRAPESRDKTSGVPKLSDLRDSGAIEQDADVVCLLRRPSYYKDDPDHEDKTLAIVDIAKQRNGPTGEVRLNFHSDFTRFEDRVEFRSEGGGAP
ncbi:MAG: replicative DNA helicase, partial [Kiritimatiellaeota bacterium]|nr:replicative DNA helicase [Kiritimatiellota bacterium]